MVDKPRGKVPTTWWFWTWVAVFGAYNAVVAFRAHGYYGYLVDYCEPDRRFQGQPGIECAGGLPFYITFVTVAWLVGAGLFSLPMLIACTHGSRKSGRRRAAPD